MASKLRISLRDLGLYTNGHVEYIERFMWNLFYILYFQPKGVKLIPSDLGVTHSSNFVQR